MKRLYKSRQNKMIDGVCGGIAEYFDADPVLVRLVFALFFFVGGAAILAYIVGMIIMPRRPLDAAGAATPIPTPQPGQPQTQSHSLAYPNSSTLIIGIIIIALGAFLLMGNFPFFRGFHHMFWHHLWDFLLPALLVGVGGILIFKANKK